MRSVFERTITTPTHINWCDQQKIAPYLLLTGLLVILNAVKNLKANQQGSFTKQVQDDRIQEISSTNPDLRQGLPRINTFVGLRPASAFRRVRSVFERTTTTPTHINWCDQQKIAPLDGYHTNDRPFVTLRNEGPCPFAFKILR